MDKIITVLISVSSLLSLTLIFSVVGLGVVSARTAAKNILILPVLGYAAVIGLSYVISANFHLSGATAVGWTLFLLLTSFFIRIKSFSEFFTEIFYKRELRFFISVIAIPLVSLLLPALIIGLNYFYGYVNPDFFYNSQDTWFLQNHSVSEFLDTGNNGYLPLDWSSNYSGRIAVTLWTAFFATFLPINILILNSVLLNTIVILFSLAMAAFCREFFQFNKKTTIVAVFFALMSAGYVQAYCYYILGQISVIPVFILFCIFSKRFFDHVKENKSLSDLQADIFILAALLNVLFVMYAIVSAIALLLFVLSYFVCTLKQSKKTTFLTLALVFIYTLGLFCLVRLFIIRETLDILSSWVHLSNRVAFGNKSVSDFIVFSEYLTETVPALLFGLTNYVSSASLYKFIPVLYKNILLFSLGLSAFLVTCLMLRSYYKSSIYPSSAKSIFIVLFGVLMVLSAAFFFSFSGYGIFKVQTWFMPILMPIYIYYLARPIRHFSAYGLKLACIGILSLNVVMSINYLGDYLMPSQAIRFMNSSGVTNNKDIFEVVDKLKNYNGKISFFVKNNYEVIWLGSLLRGKPVDKVGHNLHVLEEASPERQLCNAISDPNWAPSGLSIFNTDSFIKSDIISGGEIGEPQFANDSFKIVDASQSKVIAYMGVGSFPVGFTRGINNFPKKYRWVSKGVEVLIYSDQAREAALTMDITPGYVETKDPQREIQIKTDEQNYTYLLNALQTISVADLKLHKGLNCIAIYSNDNVARGNRTGGFLHPEISLDMRLLNFAISNIQLHLK